MNKARESAIKTPATVTVDGQPYSLRQGRIFLFFYNPSCLHCDAAARRMSKLTWNDTTVVAHSNRIAGMGRRVSARHRV